MKIFLQNTSLHRHTNRAIECGCEEDEQTRAKQLGFQGHSLISNVCDDT